MSSPLVENCWLKSQLPRVYSKPALSLLSSLDFPSIRLCSDICSIKSWIREIIFDLWITGLGFNDDLISLEHTKLLFQYPSFSLIPLLLVFVQFTRLLASVVNKELGPYYSSYSWKYVFWESYVEKLALKVSPTANKWACDGVMGAHSLLVKNNTSLEDSDDISSVTINSKQTSGHHLPHEYSLADVNLIGLISIKGLFLIITIFWFQLHVKSKNVFDIFQCFPQQCMLVVLCFPGILNEKNLLSMGWNKQKKLSCLICFDPSCFSSKK